MGATVITGKCAAAFRSNEGEVLYILFARTYEKNVYPHTDKWSAFAFGNREEVLRSIFVGIGDCCGGLLQSPKGDIKPENYLESWKQELNNPVAMRNVCVRLNFDSGWRAALPEEAKDRVSESLRISGLGHRAEAFEGEGLLASLYEDTALLRAIYGVNGALGPWRAFPHGETSTADRSDIPAVRNVPVPSSDMPSVRCFAIDSNTRLVASEDGRWMDGMWAYSALSRYAQGPALERELVQPGFAKSAIPIVREALNNAPKLPGRTRITVRRNSCTEDYRKRTVDELAREMGLVGETEIAPDEFSFVFADIAGDDAERIKYRIGSMRESITWDVPVDEGVSDSCQAQSTQTELCFA